MSHNKRVNRRLATKVIFLMKKPDSYVFLAKVNHLKQLSHVVITNDVNKIMRQVFKQLANKPNITSHSLRTDYITRLWEDFKDIEFVKQTIGH